MAKYPGLTKRGNIWYYRVKVPLDLVEAFEGQKEKKKSLQTSNLNEAKKAYFEVTKHFSDLFENMLKGDKAPDTSALHVSKELALLLARQYLEQQDKVLPDQKSVIQQLTSEQFKDALIDKHIQVELLQDQASDEGAQMVLRGAEEALTAVGIHLCFLREDHLYFVELMRRAMLELARRDLARANQDFSGETHDVLFSGSAAAGAQSQLGQPTVTFGELGEMYCLDFETSHNVTSKSLDKNLASLALITELLGPDTSVEAVDRARCRYVRDVLAKLPSNMKKKNPGFSIEQHLDAAISGNLPTLSISSQLTYLNKLKAVVKWAVAEGMMPKIEVDDLKPIGVKVPPKIKKLPFNDHQLQLIFSQPLYVGCKDDKTGYAKPGSNVIRRGRFWVPLISLFSGMRLNEICQLNISDVKTSDEGALYFSVCDDDEEKSVKTLSGVRNVLVHSELLKCGFVTYLKDVGQTKDTKLFPELNIGVTGYASDPFSKWFNDGFLKKAAAKTAKTSFHSFRHRYRDALRDALVSDEIANALGGWKTTKSTGDIYGSGYAVKVLSEQMQKIEYPDLDLSHLHQ